MADQFPPFPQNPITDIFVWRDWLYKVSTSLQAQASTNWVDLNFTSSNIIDIQTRQHNALQDIDGGGGGAYYHLNTGQYNQVTNFFNYGQWYNTADQTFTATTSTQIVFNTTVASAGMSLGSNTITINTAGTYNISYSLQFANTDTVIRYANVWVRQNGTDVVGSNSKFNVPNHHGTLDGYLVAVSNIIVSCAAGDTIELYAGVEVTNVYLEYYAAQTTPFAAPSTPSSILTIQQVA